MEIRESVVKLGLEREITVAEVAKHNTPASLWFTIGGVVYDVTKFVEDHPGGDDVLRERAGKDATQAFLDIGHSHEATRQLKKWAIGKLKGDYRPLWVDLIEQQDAAAFRECLCDKLFNINDEWKSPLYPNMTPILYAIEEACIDIVRVLLEAKADIEKAPSKGFLTPLGYAIERGQIECIRILLGEGKANPNAELLQQVKSLRGCVRWSLLGYAISKGSLDVVRALLEGGANIEKPFTCEQGGSPRAVTPLGYAIQKRNVDIVRLLVEHGANTNKAYSHSYTPLGCAIQSKSVAIARILLEHKADVQKEYHHGPNSTLMTPLGSAASTLDTEMICLLIDYGASFNDVGIYWIDAFEFSNLFGEMSCLASVCFQEHGLDILETVKYGLKCGAQLNGQNSCGNTPLHFAALMFASGFISFNNFKGLIQHGASVTAMNDAGQTPLDIAEQRAYEEALSAVGVQVFDRDFQFLISHEQSTERTLELLEAATQLSAFKGTAADLPGKKITKYATMHCVCLLQAQRERALRGSLPHRIRLLMKDHNALLVGMTHLQNFRLSREWQLVCANTDYFALHLKRETMQQRKEAVREAELAVIGSLHDGILKNRRTEAREQFLATLSTEGASARLALVAVLAELEQLKKGAWGGESVTGHSTCPSLLEEDLKTLHTGVDSQVAVAKRVKHLQVEVAAAEVEWVRLKWVQDATAEHERFKSLETELLHEVRLLNAGLLQHQITRIHKAMNATLRGRLDRLGAMQREILDYADEVERLYVELEEVVRAEPRVEETKERMLAAGRALEDSKEELSYLTLALKRKKCTEADVRDAEQLVVSNRAHYEGVVRELVQLRQLGYPELVCPAATPWDRYALVPQISLRELEVGRQIGSGTYADVYEAVLPVTGKCALKRLRTHVPVDVLVKEAATMWELRHETHVVQLLKVCLDEEQPTELRRRGLLLELMEGGSLGDLLHQRKEKLLPSRMLKLLRDVALGLAAVHERGYQHLDVKSDNVLLTAGHESAKLSDFGTAKEMRATRRDTSLKLSFRWSAPELLPQNAGELPKLTASADVWAFGMLLYEVVTGLLPFHHLDREGAVVAAVLGGSLPDIEGLDPTYVSLMRQCWARECSDRPTASQLVSILGTLMQRECGHCLDEHCVTSGVFSKNEKSFLCSECLPYIMQGMLDANTVRVDGAIPTIHGPEEVFELDALCRALKNNKDIFYQWQAAQLAARELELSGRFLRQLQHEVEEKRREWEREDHVKRLAASLTEEILGPHWESFLCPGCRVPMEYTTGCMAFNHDARKGGGCGTRFCGFCFGIFNDGSSHEHAKYCDYNPYQGNYDLPSNLNLRDAFNEIQRARKVRELRVRFKMLPKELHAPLFALLKGRFDELGVTLADLQGEAIEVVLSLI